MVQTARTVLLDEIGKCRLDSEGFGEPEEFL